MRKLTLIALLFLSCVLKVSSTQDPLYTQFMTNPYLINPALAGTYPYYQIITNSRLQWVKFPNAPITNIISMYGPTINQPMGLGGYIMHDAYGITSRTTLCGTYAYNYDLLEDLHVSLGLNLGISQFKIDGGGTTEFDDKVYKGNALTNWGPSSTLGVFVWSSTYNGGISINNLLFNKLQIGDTITGFSRLKQNFYLHGGYKYMVNRELSVEPTLIIRKIGAIPMQIDFNVRAWYAKRQWDNYKLWGGLSFRSQDAINIVLGVLFQKKIEVGYSYDIGINKMRTYHSGSHELMVGFKFNDIKKYKK